MLIISHQFITHTCRFIFFYLSKNVQFHFKKINTNMQKRTTNDYSLLVSLIRNNLFPAYPKYFTFSLRLKTFNSFPSTIPQYKYN